MQQCAFHNKTVFLLLGTKEKEIPGHKEKGIKKKTRNIKAQSLKLKSSNHGVGLSLHSGDKGDLKYDYRNSHIQSSDGSGLPLT